MYASRATKNKIYFVFFATCFVSSILAQHDSLILKNGDIIVGELKLLDKGVITIETDYSKNDFTIEWNGIKEIYSKSKFLITLKDGTRINGSFHSIDKGKKLTISKAEGQQVETTLDDVVYLRGIKSDFWSRTHANIDLGLSITKANNLRQYSGQITVGYIADKWRVGIYYNDIRSKQDSVAETKRVESGIPFIYFLPKDWFAYVAISTLSNTEQALKMRFMSKLGAGKYFIHTNRSYLGVVSGLSLNEETFTNKTSKRSSLEGLIGTEVNLFDIGDFSLLSDFFIYPSFTESGRWRSDLRLDTKYDLPLDFYIKFGITLNYDNKPAAGSKADYVFVFAVGWEL